ncbi:transcriptional regulator family: Fungal Specific TF [Penicillium argentinense]|uniref:Transcriptional regulator family: Fungal Specific TF n=1 Tax=Penicillium argentinense TaxID=1131581 RepID=A0A9W9EP33_9EURO|nr:transcriptional regulator family: Fungal Specific TF [Penicillium argentinense]KAJ5085403.1 transcriptional regulator family: Fungal Specific TF [Penicillium argentinense]
MQEDDTLHVVPPPAGKKRIPKACGACRDSKVSKQAFPVGVVSILTDCQVKCDGERPCGRCQKLTKQCVFFEIPKDPVAERLEGVESEVQFLREQLDEIRGLLQSHGANGSGPLLDDVSPRQVHEPQQDYCRVSGCTPSGTQVVHVQHGPEQSSALQYTIYPNEQNENSYRRSVPSLSSPHQISTHSQSEAPVISRLKRKRSCFEIREDSVADFIDKGLISLECAASCFDTYVFLYACFDGSSNVDRYIPIFDPQHDTFHSVRSRSSILLNAICTIGCMVETRTAGPMSDMLHAELKKWINVIIQNKGLNCLESVQAMLVVACYSSERLLILSFATRMALDLGLHEAFEELTERLATKNDEEIYGVSDRDFEREQALMRMSRTWFGLLVLEHIFRVDGGKPPGIKLIGNSRRCRILLSHPTSTVLDLRLFSQVELNILRATINDNLGLGTTLNRTGISDFVHEMKIDLDLWFDDWLRIIEGSVSAQEEKPFLLVALRVQKCWAEMMLNCKALRAMGVENVAAMTTTERHILLTAKYSARRHLRLIIVEPDFYLAKLKYAMDFVWAKCAFSFLLLLKLSRLLPERDEEHQELLEHGDRLIHELNKAGSNSSQSGAGNIYLQILKVSIEKYGRALQESQQPSTGGSTATSPFWELFDAQADLQWFVPEQFVSEWDFPGLNLFYFPTAWQDFFGDFSLAM